MTTSRSMSGRRAVARAELRELHRPTPRQRSARRERHRGVRRREGSARDRALCRCNRSHARLDRRPRAPIARQQVPSAPGQHRHLPLLDVAATAIGLKGLTPHELRHIAASLAVSAGANVKAVQRMLGHASAAVTLDVYADLFDDDLDSVATALDQAAMRSDVANLLPKAA